MNSPEFLTDLEDEAIDQDALTRLKSLIDAHIENETHIEKAETALKQLTKYRKELEQEQIPQLLLQHGLSEIRLASGEKVTIKEDISVTLPFPLAFFKFLQERGEDDIVKLGFRFDKMPEKMQEQLFDWLQNNNYEYEVTQDVHAQTRLKYFRDLLGVGKDDTEEGIKEGKYLRTQDVVEFAKIFHFYRTKIK